VIQDIFPLLFLGVDIDCHYLLLIMNSIGDLIENENFSRLSEEEKQYI
jgi:cytochrome c oxidase cbb3-type subunit 3